MFDTAIVAETKGFLKLGEHARASRYGKGHAAKFTEQFVELLGGDTAAIAEQVEQFLDSVEAVRRELNSSTDGVSNVFRVPQPLLFVFHTEK